MIKLLSSPFFSMTLGGISFLLTIFFLIQEPMRIASAPPEEPEEVQAQAGFWQRHNPEVDQLLQELQREKRELDKRAAQLRELEIRLQSERAEIDQVTERVAQLQVEFDQNVTRIKEEEIPNLKKLAKLYSTMSPEGASAVFRELEDDVVVKILSYMKDAQSAPLLDAMAKESAIQAARAAGILESLRTTLADPEKK